ncbi:MAG: methyltransferase domain-containing protein [Anaerolineales bacterium]
MVQNSDDNRAGYDPIAGEYAETYFNELLHKPLDRQLLHKFAKLVEGLGPVCDLGCGPGQIARYLKDRGIPAFGLDLSQRMVEKARQLSPDIDFIQGDMTALEVDDNSWGGIVAFYSIIHIPNEQIPETLQELHRVLVPGGWLLLSFHIGDETIHFDEWYGKEVSITSTFFPTGRMEACLEEVGFELVETIERDPYPDIEYDSRRAYIFTRKSIA